MALPPSRHLLRAKDLADARYADPLTVVDLATAARLSPAHFSREFRRAFGESPHQYLLTRRLERAARMLRSTDWSVARVCVSVGLSSVGSFTVSFRRMFGLTPTAYRAAHPPAAEVARVPACVVRAWGRPQVRTFREDPAPPRAMDLVEPAGRARTTDTGGARHDEDRHRAAVGARPGRGAEVLDRQGGLRGAQ